MCFDPATAIAGITSAAKALGSTLGGLGTVASIGGGALSAYAQVQNARAQAEALTRTAEANDRAALQAIEQGQDESDQRRQAGAALLARNRAAMAANGIDVGSEQALDVLDDTRLQVEEDAFAIRETARRRADGFAQASANAQAGALTERRNAFFAPVQTALTTASSVGRRYASWVPEARGQGGF